MIKAATARIEIKSGRAFKISSGKASIHLANVAGRPLFIKTGPDSWIRPAIVFLSPKFW
jgi:hypothetical protein